MFDLTCVVVKVGCSYRQNQRRDLRAMMPVQQGPRQQEHLAWVNAFRKVVNVGKQNGGEGRQKNLSKWWDSNTGSLDSQLAALPTAPEEDGQSTVLK